MANLFDLLPLPVGNGPGTAVDVSGMGRDKTIIVDGAFPHALIAIEISNDGGTNYAPVATFQEGKTKLVIPNAAQWMRTNVSGRSSIYPFTATVYVGADDAGGLFADLPMPVGNGAGASVDVAAFGQFATFIVAGTFPGAAVGIEASDDNTDWAPVCLFASKGGQKNVPQTANFYRVVVTGRETFNPFTASASVGAVNDAGGGGGGGGGSNDVVLANDSAGALLAGTPVYSSSDGGVNKGDATNVAKSIIVGLVVPQPSIPLGGTGAIRTAGPLTLPTATWDLVTGEVGGLTINAEYYLDFAAPGKLTRNPPQSPAQDGDVVAALGTAVSSQIFVIRVQATTDL